MIDKEYLDKLKEEDYMAWDDLVNDPMIVGQDTAGDFILPTIVLIVIIGIVVVMCL
ncbi:hypothetical protein ACFFVB_18315 [Formosa undariae]|uniref:Uncharacterized protein n=1 Tax=Formosa undariae TaxID=1325436 RepID=A0ABV5F6G6_9FLAO